MSEQEPKKVQNSGMCGELHPRSQLPHSRPDGTIDLYALANHHLNLGSTPAEFAESVLAADDREVDWSTMVPTSLADTIPILRPDTYPAYRALLPHGYVGGFSEAEFLEYLALRNTAEEYFADHHNSNPNPTIKIEFTAIEQPGPAVAELAKKMLARLGNRDVGERYVAAAAAPDATVLEMRFNQENCVVDGSEYPLDAKGQICDMVFATQNAPGERIDVEYMPRGLGAYHVYINGLSASHVAMSIEKFLEAMDRDYADWRTSPLAAAQAARKVADSNPDFNMPLSPIYDLSYARDKPTGTDEECIAAALTARRGDERIPWPSRVAQLAFNTYLAGLPQGEKAVSLDRMAMELDRRAPGWHCSEQSAVNAARGLSDLFICRGITNTFIGYDDPIHLGTAEAVEANVQAVRDRIELARAMQASTPIHIDIETDKKDK